MKKAAFSVVFCFALASCLPASALTPGPSPYPGRGESAITPTPLTPDTSRLTPSPTPLPPTETPAPTATESVPSGLAAAQSLKYDEKSLANFSGVEIKTVTVGGETKTGLVGTRTADGSEQILGLEINGQMTRVGEWTDTEGHSFFVYVNPDYDPLQRILATEKTPQVLTDFLFARLASGQFRGLAGGDASILKKHIFNNQNNGKISLDLPVAAPETNDDWAVKWIPSPTKADFTKPIEVMTVFGKDADEFMKTSPLAEKIMDNRGNADRVYGGLIWVADDGHIQIILLETGSDGEFAVRGTPSNLEEKNGWIKLVRSRAGWNLFALLKELEYYQNPDAFLLKMKYSAASYDRISRDLWDYSLE